LAEIPAVVVPAPAASNPVALELSRSITESSIKRVPASTTAPAAVMFLMVTLETTSTPPDSRYPVSAFHVLSTYELPPPPTTPVLSAP
jgi:hypothetical protein